MQHITRLSASKPRPIIQGRRWTGILPSVAAAPAMGMPNGLKTPHPKKLAQLSPTFFSAISAFLYYSHTLIICMSVVHRFVRCLHMPLPLAMPRKGISHGDYYQWLLSPQIWNRNQLPSPLPTFGLKFSPHFWTQVLPFWAFFL